MTSLSFFKKANHSTIRLFGLGFIFLLLVCRVDWLALPLLFIWLTELLILRKISGKRIWLYAILLPLNILLLAVYLKIFIAEVFVVPSDSMENTLFPGDKILVSKLSYGAAVPGKLKDVPWIGIFFAGHDELRSGPSEIPAPLFRTKGFSKISRGDLVVFKIKYGGERFLVKRCIGLPGDRVTIRDSATWVNDRLYSRALIKHSYLIGDNNDRTKVELTNIQLDSLKKKCPGCLLKVVSDTGKVYPYNALFSWNRNFWGPVLVPRKGLRILLDKYNLALYEKIIRFEVGGQADMKHDGYYVNGRKTDYYIFQKDYYIMLGDNRDNSADSRFWGFCSAANIIGKVII